MYPKLVMAYHFKVRAMSQHHYLCTMQIVKKALKIIAGALLVVLMLLIIFAIYVVSVSTLKPPKTDHSVYEKVAVEKVNAEDIRYGQNHLFHAPSGHWELYLEGAPFERGVINGKLCADLLYKQELNFTDQIRSLVPSPWYLNFLKYFVGFFNRNLNDHIPLEYREEIYGVALSAPDTFDFVSAKYDRMLNYHAAHDIGHALQNLALVGCTSFAVWGDQSANGDLIVGRNFDFYVGDGFAEDKIVSFLKPDSGYAFMSVTWGGMIGVVSGMNEHGLTITLNAAPSEIPSGAATPISLLAREILQYARNITEAFEIAKTRETFVSESLLIGSAEDGIAAIIEKTPTQTQLFNALNNRVVCANHFQSNSLKVIPINQEVLNGSDSPYRYALMEQSLDTSGALDAEKSAEILRSRAGLNGDTLGMGNPMALNQLIAHHGIIFKPEERLVWVSASPYQLGAFVAYDLKQIFGKAQHPAGQSMAIDSLIIAADPFLETDGYSDFVVYRAWLQKMNHAMRESEHPFSPMDIEQQLALNPFYYHGYVLAGNYFTTLKNNHLAVQYYEKALALKIPSLAEREKIESLLKSVQENE
jgi:isopenicillin-N N-acyltransferase-like protein